MRKKKDKITCIPVRNLKRTSLHLLLCFISIYCLCPLFLLANPSFTQQDSVHIKVISTGQTTGHIADLYLTSLNNNNITYEIPPFFIPSENDFQPYLTITDTIIRLNESIETRIKIMGYCADIFLDPVPKYETFPDFSKWIKIQTKLENQRPVLTPHLWVRDPKSRLLNPVTSAPIGHSIDINKYPKEVAWILWHTVKNLEKSYEGLNQQNQLLTPYSEDKNKEKWAVIQHSFWIFTSELGGKYYPRDFFESKINQQYNQVSYSTIPENDRIDRGISQFWYAFHQLLNEAKVLNIFKRNTRYIKVEDAEILLLREKEEKH